MFKTTRYVIADSSGNVIDDSYMFLSLLEAIEFINNIWGDNSANQVITIEINV